ncbi:MAG: PEP-CTERM sorting domain-containing protein [Verrucomicrobiota bacterium]
MSQLRYRFLVLIAALLLLPISQPVLSQMVIDMEGVPGTGTAIVTFSGTTSFASAIFINFGVISFDDLGEYADTTFPTESADEAFSTDDPGDSAKIRNNATNQEIDILSITFRNEPNGNLEGVTLSYAPFNSFGFSVSATDTYTISGSATVDLASRSLDIDDFIDGTYSSSTTSEGASGNPTTFNINVIPEPSSLMLLLGGAGSLYFLRRLRS